MSRRRNNTTTMTMKKKTTNYLRADYPLADTYLDSLALKGALPECKYPNNGVPKLRDNPVQTPVLQLYAFDKRRG